ncbi:MAG: zinc ABC transporter substrate-binding protein [Acidobacteriota bacterium]
MHSIPNTSTFAITTRAAATSTARSRSPEQPRSAFGGLFRAVALATLLLAGPFAFWGCGAGSDDVDDPRPRVVATTGMIADLAERLGGDRVRVEALMGPGIDPHLYKPSESAVRRLADADLILYNGLFLEGKMGEILERLAQDRPVVAVAERVDSERLLVPDDAGGHPDPHLWFDVGLWAETVPAVAEALATIAPEHAAEIQERAEATTDELLALDAWAAERVATIPEAARILVTAHDAFGYFGTRYGLDVVGVQGLSTVAEAGLRDVDRVVDLVAERRVPAIFVESSVPRRTVEAVQRAVRERGHEVAIGGELFSDAMGAPGTLEGTYDGMVRHNVNTIVEALAPAADDAAAVEDGVSAANGDTAAAEGP